MQLHGRSYQSSFQMTFEKPNYSSKSQKNVNGAMDQSECEANPRDQRQAPENACREVTIDFNSTFHWLRKCPIRKRITAKPKQTRIPFGTHLKTALISSC